MSETEDRRPEQGEAAAEQTDQAQIVRRLTALVSRHLTAVIVTVAVGGTAWILVQTWHGACANTDAVFYLSAGENLGAGRGLVDFRGDELYWFPPGFPVSLALFEVLGIGAAEGGRWLNAIVFGATILVSGLCLKSICRSPVIVMAGVLAIACSRVFHYGAGCLHSDPLYLLLTLGSLILVSEFGKRSSTGGALQALRLMAVAGLLAGLSVTVRYVGVVAIASSVLLVLFWQPTRSVLRTRMKAATLFGLAAALPIVAVLARNFAGTGKILADRLDHSTGHTMLDAIETIIRLHGRWQPTFAVGLIMLIAAVLIFWMSAGRDRHSRFPRWFGINRSAPFGAFVLTHVFTLVVSQPWNSGPGVLPRLYLPAALALVFVGCEALDKAIGPTAPSPSRDARSKPGRNLVLAGTCVVIVVALASASYINAVRTRAAHIFGHHPGAIVEGITESPLIDDLRHHAEDDRYYSNRPLGVYLLTGIQPVRNLPAWWPWTSPSTESECLNELAALQRASLSETGRLRIAWFDSTHEDDSRIYCDIPDLASRSSELELVQDFPDGAIYRFDPSG